MNCYEMRVIVMTWGESSHPLVGLQCDDSWHCMFVVNDMRRITTSWWWFMTLYVCSKWTRCYRMLHAIIDEMREALPPMFSREPEDRAVRTLHTQYTVHWLGLSGHHHTSQAKGNKQTSSWVEHVRVLAWIWSCIYAMMMAPDQGRALYT